MEEYNLPKYHYSWFQSLIQKLACTRMGASFLAHSAYHADRLIYKLSRGRTTLASIVSGIPVVMLTTQGAKTSIARTTPVLCVVDPTKPDRFAVIASNLGQKHNPAWYYNLKANPHAGGTIDGQTKAYRAHEAGEDEYARFWQIAINIYPGYKAYKNRARRHIPIMVMTPEK